MDSVRLMTYNPGHFHAALVQKEMVPGAAPRVDVYAPLGADLSAHLLRLAAFNARARNPTAWEVEVHASDDALARMLRERPGNVVVLSGRNRDKIHAIKAAVEAGLNVLADKPWVIDADDLPLLESALDTADRKGVIAYDIMTERHEITSILQGELVADADVFGAAVPGTRDEPGVFMESMHYLMKLVAGVPNRRPAWFFDVRQQGEGLTDVGTHLVDLVMWILFPEIALDYRKDVEMLAAKRWPTVIGRDDFRRVTGEADFPDFLAPAVRDGRLDYSCNTLASPRRAAAGALPQHRRRGSARRVTHHDPRRVSRRPRGPLRRGDAAVFGVSARAGYAVGVGEAEHAGEVFRDDQGGPTRPRNCRRLEAFSLLLPYDCQLLWGQETLLTALDLPLGR